MSMRDELLDMSVDDIMRRWPDTIRVFLNLHLLCVGCPIGAFHTLIDAAKEHHIDTSQLLEKMNIAIGQQTLQKAP